MDGALTASAAGRSTEELSGIKMIYNGKYGGTITCWEWKQNEWKNKESKRMNTMKINTKGDYLLRSLFEKNIVLIGVKEP